MVFSSNSEQNLHRLAEKIFAEIKAFDENLSPEFEVVATIDEKSFILEKVYSWSEELLDYENKNNPYEDKKFQISDWRFIATENITEENEEIILTAEKLQAEKNFKTYDALHTSCAIFANCEYFITVDKKLLNTPVDEIKIVSPITFLQEVE